VDRTGQNDRGAAEQIARLLGYLPLALEHAGAYVEASGISLAKYLAKIRQYTSSSKSPSELKAVFATWHLGMQAAASESVLVAGLLGSCCYLAPEKLVIPQFFSEIEVVRLEWYWQLRLRFIRFVHRLTSGRSNKQSIPLSAEFDIETALKALKKFSLVQTDGTYFWFHELVLQTAREYFTHRFSHKWRLPSILKYADAGRAWYFHNQDTKIMAQNSFRLVTASDSFN